MVFLVLAGWALAQQEEVPAVQRQGSVEYIVGKAGLEKSDAAAGHKFNLGLTFATREGDFVGEVHLEVADEAGNRLLDVLARGPRVLVALPAGGYKVRATFFGRTLSKEATVGADGLMEVQFVWPAPESHALKIP